MNKDRILIVLPNDILGGAEKILKIIATEFAKRGYDVDVVFLKKSVDGSWDDIKNIVNLKFSNFDRERKAYPFIANKIRILSKAPYLYTFSSNTSVNGILGILRRLSFLKTKYLIVRESTQIMDRFKGLKRFIYYLLYRYGYKFQDLVIYQTEFMRESLEKALKFSKKWNNRVIKNPIYIENVIKKSVEKIDLPSDKKFILSVGRMIHLKGFDLLIKAFKKLNEDYNLILVGDGPEMKSLKELSINLGIEDRIIFVGYKNNPYPYMKAADACVISSRVEGFPNTLLQMMTLNDKVISTLCAGGIKEIKGLITCQINSEDELFEAINSVINLNSSQISENRKNFNLELEQRAPKDFIDTIISNF